MSPRAHAARLIETVPRILVGPDAARALAGERGVLLGAKRPRWVDVLAFDERARMTWQALVGLRFESFHPWEVVGLSLSASEFSRLRERLLSALVPGDALVTERGASFHVGDRWSRASIARG